MNEKKSYTTDNKVVHYSKDEDVNIKLAKIIGPKFTEYRKRWDAINNFSEVSEFPMFLHLDMNQNCNLACPHCIVGHKSIYKNYYQNNLNPLSWEDYQKVILEGEEFGCPSMTPQGNNEPLLMSDLEKYILFANKHGFFDIMMNTNAILLTEERSKSILDAGFTRLRFSLDAATSDTYYKVRNNRQYNKIKKNIKTFLNLKEKGGYKLPITGVSLCKMSNNEHEVNMFYEKWKNMVDIITIQTFIPPFFEKDFSSYYPKDQTYQNENPKKFQCPQPFQRVVIRNYEITPCCAMFSNLLKIGDLKDGIYNAWNSDLMKNIQEIHANGNYQENKICKQCVDLVFPRK